MFQKEGFGSKFGLLLIFYFPNVYLGRLKPRLSVEKREIVGEKEEEREREREREREKEN